MCQHDNTRYLDDDEQVSSRRARVLRQKRLRNACLCTWLSLVTLLAVYLAFLSFTTLSSKDLEAKVLQLEARLMVDFIVRALT